MDLYLESSYAHHYTTNATQPYTWKFGMVQNNKKYFL